MTLLTSKGDLSVEIAIRKLLPEDRQGWERLARGYKSFYRTPTTSAEFDATWLRLVDDAAIHGLVALAEGELVGLAHYLYHPVIWGEPACYLQDLFTADHARGHGVGTALIGAVASEARSRSASRCYWLTHTDNLVARSLYDKLARYRGFIRYEASLAVR